MLIENFKHLGGRHHETAILRSLLAHAGVLHPQSGEPLGESLLMGIAGGIGAGFLFCPSIPGYGNGSGMSLLGRHLAGATKATYLEGALTRLGATPKCIESSGEKGAFKHLKETLATGTPAIVYATRRLIPWLVDPCGCSVHYDNQLAVVGIDEAAGVAIVSERATVASTMSLDNLAAARTATCSHKNRQMTFDPPTTLDVEKLNDAVRAGLVACVDDLENPRIKTFGYESVEKWSALIPNPKNKLGWAQLYPGGKVYAALRDMYDSIETMGTGGGLFRAMFATFLDEAAALLKSKALAECAQRSRELAAGWSELAQTALPKKIKPFKETQELLAKHERLIEERGSVGSAEWEKLRTRLTAINREMIAKFALDEKETAALLADVGAKMCALVVRELQAREMLKSAVK